MTKSPKRGRPPSPEGGKTEYYSARMTPALLQALQGEADRRGMSVSATAEDLIASGLKRRGPSGALLTLIERLIEHAPHWDTNPYHFEAFKTALVRLLDALRPEGEVVIPTGRDRLYPGPAEDYGKILLMILFREAMREADSRSPGAMSSAYRDLNLEERRDKLGG